MSPRVYPMEILTTLLVTVFCGSFACGPPTPVRHVVDRAEGSLLEPTRSAAHQAFDQALADGRIDGARSALATLEGEVEPSRYALLEGRLALAEERFADAEQAFRSVDIRSSDDTELLSAGQLYLALSLARSGSPQRALASLGDTPHEVGPSVAAPDRAEVAVLIGEAAWSHQDTRLAVQAFSRAVTFAEAASQKTLATYSRSRVFDIMSGLELPALVAQVEEGEALARAAAGYELVRAYIESEERELAEAAFAQAAPWLEASGESLRIAELSQSLSSTGSSASLMVGAVLPLTGPSRRVGRRVMAGLLQAQGAFFPSGRSRVTLVFKDSASSPEVAAQAMLDLSALGALAVLGPLGRDTSRAAAEVAEQVGLPMLSLAVDGRLAAMGPYVFRYGLDTGEEIALLVERAFTTGSRKVLILRPTTQYGETLAALFEEAAGAFPELQIVSRRTYDPSDRDHRKLAEDLVELEFDTVFLPDSVQNASLMASFLAQQNIWSTPEGFIPGSRDPRRFVQLLGTSAWYDPTALESPDRYLEGAVFPTPWALEIEDEPNVLFVETFRELYGRDPGLYEALAYDSMRLVRELLLTRSLTTRSRIREELGTGESFRSVTGKLTFDLEGDASPSPRLMQLTSEGVQWVEPLSMDTLIEASEPGEESPLAPMEPVDPITSPGEEVEEPAITDPLDLPGLED